MLAALALLAEVVRSSCATATLARMPAAIVGWGVLPLLPCALAWAVFTAQRAGLAADRSLAIALVVPIAPLLDRIALQPIADASVLVLLIVSLALHFLLSGLGLLFFGPEGSRTHAAGRRHLDDRAAATSSAARRC